MNETYNDVVVEGEIVYDAAAGNGDEVVETENSNYGNLDLNLFYKESESETYADVNKTTSSENAIENKNENSNFSLNVENKNDRVSVMVISKIRYELVKDLFHSFNSFKKQTKKKNLV